MMILYTVVSILTIIMLARTLRLRISTEKVCRSNSGKSHPVVAERVIALGIAALVAVTKTIRNNGSSSK